MNEIVLITGVNSGIGKATAELLYKNGYKVYGIVKNEKRLKEANEYFKGKIELLVLDLNKIEKIKEKISKLIEKEGKIDVLINNAGYGQYGAVEDLSYDLILKQFNINVFSYIELIKQVIPYMRKQKKGKIINISSIAGRFSLPFTSAYCSSKFALEAFSFALRYELKNFGIQVAIVEPGFTKTEFHEKAMKSLENLNQNSIYKNYYKTFLKFDKKILNKATSVEKVAKLILKIVKSKKIKYRYTVNFKDSLSIAFVKILPEKILNKLLEIYFK